MSDLSRYSSDEIEGIIANRIKEGEQLGLPIFADALYSKFKQWSYRLEKENSDWVGKKYIRLIKSDDCEIEINTYDNKVYAVKKYDKNLASDDYDRDTVTNISKISIVVDGKTVFTTTLTETTVFYDSGPCSSTSASGVLSYIPGQWFEDIKALWLKIKVAEDEQVKAIHKANMEMPEKILELKTKWGI